MTLLHTKKYFIFIVFIEEIGHMTNDFINWTRVNAIVWVIPNSWAFIINITG